MREREAGDRDRGRETLERNRIREMGKMDMRGETENQGERDRRGYVLR